MKWIKALFVSQVGRFTLVALTILGLAALGKLYYQEHTKPQSVVQSETLSGNLEGVAKALEDFAAKQPEGASPFPKDAGWTPRVLPCGESMKLDPTEAEHPTWKALGLKLDGEVRYQYRLRARDKEVEVLARADFDCDGLYQVHRIKARTNWQGFAYDGVRVDNQGE